MAVTRSGVRAGLRRRGRDPVFWTDVIQLTKTAAAAVIAWVLATTVWDLPQSFLAPWAALLVVHATVYRTFSEGLRQVGAAVLGVLLAWGVGHLLGLDTTAVAVALLIGLVIGAAPWFEGQATGVAATALVVLTTGFSDNDSMLLSRLLDTGIGIVVGLLVNLVVWPPLRRRTAVVAMDAIDDKLGALLQDMARGIGDGFDEEEVDGWVDRTRRLDEELDHAWALLRQARESARMNPRRSAAALRDPVDWHRLLRRMEQANAESRSMARTLATSLAHVNDWEPRFRAPYLALLEDAGTAIAEADPEMITVLRHRLDDLVHDLSAGEMSRLWPEYGGLMINLRNILAAMGEVAASNPMSQPPVPFAAAG